jgi:hypothetical protein
MSWRISHGERHWSVICGTIVMCPEFSVIILLGMRGLLLPENWTGSLHVNKSSRFYFICGWKLLKAEAPVIVQKSTSCLVWSMIYTSTHQHQPNYTWFWLGSTSCMVYGLWSIPIPNTKYQHQITLANSTAPKNTQPLDYARNRHPVFFELWKKYQYAFCGATGYTVFISFCFKELWLQWISPFWPVAIFLGCHWSLSNFLSLSKSWLGNKGLNWLFGCLKFTFISSH